MSQEKWYWKGNGVFSKDQLKKKIKEDIIHQDDKSLAHNIQEMKNLKDDLFEYFDSITKNKENQ